MLRLRLSTTLLLAATCLLFSTGFSRPEMTKQFTCEYGNAVHRLSCDSGVISVQTALYGREDNETCSEGRTPQELIDTNCIQEGTLDVLRTRCNGKKVCELNIDDVRTSDPCSGIHKYLETTHTCIPAIHSVTCEKSVANLQCAEGQYITVFAADYGRRDRATCSYERPTTEIQDVTCSMPTSKVAESCDGTTSCDVTVSNSEFGDPCPGTYKYLEVAYECHTGMTACEWSVASLQCGHGRVINVRSAVYGRSNQITCSSGQPDSKIENVSCSKPISLVSKSCDGQNSCNIFVSKYLFGDPCADTSKYLEVDYTCQ